MNGTRQQCGVEGGGVRAEWPECQYFEKKVLLSSLADPDRHLGASFRADGCIRSGRHPAALHSPTVDVQGSHAAADADGNAVPQSIGQAEAERFKARRSQVRVQQPDLIFASAAL